LYESRLLSQKKIEILIVYKVLHRKYLDEAENIDISLRVRPMYSGQQMPLKFHISFIGLL